MIHLILFSFFLKLDFYWPGNCLIGDSGFFFFDIDLYWLGNWELVHPSASTSVLIVRKTSSPTYWTSAQIHSLNSWHCCQVSSIFCLIFLSIVHSRAITDSKWQNLNFIPWLKYVTGIEISPSQLCSQKFSDVFHHGLPACLYSYLEFRLS